MSSALLVKAETNRLRGDLLKGWHREETNNPFPIIERRQVKISDKGEPN